MELITHPKAALVLKLKLACALAVVALTGGLFARCLQTRRPQAVVTAGTLTAVELTEGNDALLKLKLACALAVVAVTGSLVARHLQTRRLQALAAYQHALQRLSQS